MTDEQIKARIKELEGPAIRELAKLYKRNRDDRFSGEIIDMKEEIVESLIMEDDTFDDMPWCEVEALVEELA